MVFQVRHEGKFRRQILVLYIRTQRTTTIVLLTCPYAEAHDDARPAARGQAIMAPVRVISLLPRLREPQEEVETMDAV